MKSISWLATASARACRVALMPERRSARRDRSSSAIDIVIGLLLWVSLRVAVPERLVLGETLDVGVALGRCAEGGGRRDRRDPALQGALERGVGEHLRIEQACAHHFDVGASVSAREIGQAVERAVSGSPQAGEQFPGELCGPRSDTLGLREQAGALTRWVEDAVLRLDLEAALAGGLLMPAQQASAGVQYLDVMFVDSHRHLAVRRGWHR